MVAEITGAVGLLLRVMLIGEDGLLTQVKILHLAVKVVTGAEGLTSIDDPKTPLFQVIVPVQPVAVRITEAPGQTVVLVADIIGGATVFTIIWMLFELGLKQDPT